ncbi:carbohydrate ABC transporter permease [Yinghuangia soli]|uniref:Sugar ABC transporter permease n=1 Tax=Yinghuangia soli TaxID=2908204 RepID=A0AA41Q1E6_9ACTN|nr:sugar ABC transporter permease [Yinghuangia soli]MCF2529175.1 sugar ABC transporter permease [Yinghuangia soli]
MTAAVPPALRAQRRRRTARTVAFLSPWLIGFAVFFAYPLGATVYYSFTRYDLINPPEWVGLQNWRYVFRDYPYLDKALRNTLWLVAIMVPVRVLFGLGVGMIAVRLRRGANLFRTLCYLPFLAPPVAATIGFVFLLNPATGPFDQFLAGLGLGDVGWFNDPQWAKPALTVLAVWGVGDLMVIFVAALVDVPREQYEAAQLDGAGAWQRFRYVTWPAITPIVLFAVVTGVIQTMQYYTQAMVAGKVASGIVGAPGQSFEPGYPDGSTLTLPQLVYEEGFSTFDTGAASVLSLILFGIAMTVTALLMRRRAGLLGDD